MTKPLHKNVGLVVAEAEARGLTIEPRQFDDSTRTAVEAANAIGVELAQIVKSLVFLADGEPVLALVCGDSRLDEKLLATATGAGAIGRADADRVARRHWLSRGRGPTVRAVAAPDVHRPRPSPLRRGVGRGGDPARELRR